MTGAFEVVVLAAVGLIVGSAMPAVAARVPDRQPVFEGLSARDITPLSGWFGTSRWPRPVVIGCEAVTALLFGALAVRFGLSMEILPYLVLFAALVVISVIDLEHYRIPDRITFPAFGTMLVLVVVASVVRNNPVEIAVALAGAFLYFFLLFVPHLISPAGMGFGDVKLALAMGLGLGWINPVLVFGALLLSSLLGVVAGMVLRIVRKERAAFPFGPALAVGTVLTVLASNSVLDLMGN